MGDVGNSWNWVAVTKSQLWWNILFMPSQCIFIFIAIAYLYQLCNSTDWFSFTEFDGIRGLPTRYSIAHRCLSTCLCYRDTHVPWHTTTWQTHGARQPSLVCCNRTRNVGTDQAQAAGLGFALAYLAAYFSWQNPTLMVRIFLSQGGGGRDPRTTGTGRGRRALWFCPVCCDRSAMSCVLVSILTHRLPRCLVG